MQLRCCLSEMHETFVWQSCVINKMSCTHLCGSNGWPAPALVESEGEERPDANNDKPS